MEVTAKDYEVTTTRARDRESSPVRTRVSVAPISVFATEDRRFVRPSCRRSQPRRAPLWIIPRRRRRPEDGRAAVPVAFGEAP